MVLAQAAAALQARRRQLTVDVRGSVACSRSPSPPTSRDEPPTTASARARRGDDATTAAATAVLRQTEAYAGRVGAAPQMTDDSELHALVSRLVTGAARSADPNNSAYHHRQLHHTQLQY